MAVIGKPKIVLIDVVTAGIDPATRRLVWQALKEEAANSATVISSQSIDAAQYLSDKLAIMLDGEIQRYGTVQEILQKHKSDFQIEFHVDVKKVAEDLPDEDEVVLLSDKDQVLEVLKEWQQIFTENELKTSINFAAEFR